MKTRTVWLLVGLWIHSVTGLSSGLFSRRSFVVSTGAAASGGALFPSLASAASTSSAALIDELKQSKDKLAPIPDLLEAQEWDKVRSILKVPPVNKLWNLGDSVNPVLKLAQATDNVDLIETKDELALNLQMCDQLTYDNAFVYFQPGNGKYKIKEPQTLARSAMKQLQDIIDASQ